MAAVSRCSAVPNLPEPYSTNTARPRGIDRTKGDKNRQDHHDVHRGYREDGDKDRQDHHDGHRSNGDDSDGRITSIKGTSAVSHHKARFPGPYDVPPDRIYARHKGSVIPIYFPAYHISEGKAMVGDLRQQIAARLPMESTLPANSPRLQLVYKGTRLRSSLTPLIEYDIKYNSEVVVVVADDVAD